MRVVLDTNVSVAALLTQGVAAQVVDLWLAGRYTLLTLLRRQAEVVARPRPPGLSPDPDDDLLLGIALVGRADCKVKGLRILSVRSFLREVS